MDDFLFENKGPVMIIYLSRELDHHLAGLVRTETDAAIDKGKVRYLIFDFEGVNFMDSSGIGMIMGRYRKMKFFGGKVFVTGIRPSVERIFSMSGLYRLIPKYESVDAAMERIS